MRNCIQLRQKLGFGKHRGLTGAELLKSEEGTGYLVWCYNNTDIQMEGCIVSHLISARLVYPKKVRENSDADRRQTCGQDGKGPFDHLIGKRVTVKVKTSNAPAPWQGVQECDETLREQDAFWGDLIGGNN